MVIRFSTLALSVLALSGCSTPQPTGESQVPASRQAGEGIVDTSGRRLVVRNGRNYYCKRQKTTGSRLRDSEQCLTLEQLGQQQQSVRAFISESDTHTEPPREQ